MLSFVKIIDTVTQHSNRSIVKNYQKSVSSITAYRYIVFSFTKVKYKNLAGAAILSLAGALSNSEFIENPDSSTTS